MIVLGQSQAIEGSATSATTVTYSISGGLTDNSSPPNITAGGYQVLAQGQLAATAGSIYNPGASNSALISSIYLTNTGATAQTVQLYLEGTAAGNEIWGGIIPPNGTAAYEDGIGWTVYSASGLIVSGSGTPGGVGTPATSAGSNLTASSANLIVGSSVALATNQLFVGSRYRWTLGVNKTAASTAAWSAAVKFGVNNTTADAAIATWTSGTNTAAIDQAILIIIMQVTALGASATAACLAYYVNRLTDATGLGNIAAAPSPTAAFNSTATSPFLHVNITPGTSAVMTAWADAERLV